MDYKWFIKDVIPVPTDRNTVAVIVGSNKGLDISERKQYTILVDNSQDLSKSINRVSKFLGLPFSTHTEDETKRVCYEAIGGYLRVFIGSVEIYSKTYLELPLPSLRDILTVYLEKAQQYMKVRG